MTDEVALRLPVALPSGDVTVSAAGGVPAAAWCGIAIAHGAGSGYDHPLTIGFAAALREAGVATLRFNFPYREAGRRMPGPAPHAIAAWIAAAEALGELVEHVPLFVSGRSYGGRMASMMLADHAPTAVVGGIYLGYPLHPPGKPDAPRVEHLPRVAAAQLFVSGTRDPFIDPPEQLVAAVGSCPDADLVWVDGAGHSFEVAGRHRPADQIGADLAPIAVEWMRRRTRSDDQRPTA